MAPTHSRSIFTRKDLHDRAAEILQVSADPIPTFRLMREVLRLPADNSQLLHARAAAMHSKWVMQLQSAQLPNGSWGRFHSQDTKAKTVFRTSEEAIDRAFSLGLAPDHLVLTQASVYIENVIKGNADITDRPEKNAAWPLLIRFILVGRLAQIDPGNPAIEIEWEYLAEVAKQSFRSGEYQLMDEVEAYQRLSGTHVPQGFLESQHALWILATRPLPNQLEHKLIAWLWNKPDGIRYLRAALSEPQPRQIAYWLRSMNILTCYKSWRSTCLPTLNRLWDGRDDQGLWDFGSQTGLCPDFPLSENWRYKAKRKTDYSTCMLVLLRRYFD